MAITTGTGVNRLLDGAATFGNTVGLAGQALRWVAVDIATGRFPFREAVSQTWFVIVVTSLPAILVAVPFGVIVSVQVGSLTQQVGATSIAGAAGASGLFNRERPSLPPSYSGARPDQRLPLIWVLERFAKKLLPWRHSDSIRSGES